MPGEASLARRGTVWHGAARQTHCFLETGNRSLPCSVRRGLAWYGPVSQGSARQCSAGYSKPTALGKLRTEVCRAVIVLFCMVSRSRVVQGAAEFCLAEAIPLLLGNWEQKIARTGEQKFAVRQGDARRGAVRLVRLGKARLGSVRHGKLTALWKLRAEVCWAGRSSVWSSNVRQGSARRR